MRHAVAAMMELDHERRSGMPGLGDRPQRHPAWGERLQSHGPIEAGRQDLERMSSAEGGIATRRGERTAT